MKKNFFLFGFMLENEWTNGAQSARQRDASALIYGAP